MSNTMQLISAIFQSAFGFLGLTVPGFSFTFLQMFIGIAVFGLGIGFIKWLLGNTITVGMNEINAGQDRLASHYYEKKLRKPIK